MRFWKFVTIAVLTFGCQQQKKIGFIHVHSSVPGNFEIFRIAAQKPVQFVAEQVGSYNINVPLEVGRYLVISDCSSRQVLVEAGEVEELLAHSLKFVPPPPATATDDFTIQCSRYEETRSRQMLRNRYQINVLAGERDLLVGLVPFQISLPRFDEGAKPTIRSLALSGVKVELLEGASTDATFFVSPRNRQISITSSQQFGNRLLVMPGSYVVEVNGTSVDVQLEEGENRTILPARIRVASPKQTQLARSPEITGSPITVKINGGNWLNLDQNYFVLPGPAKIRLTGSEMDYPIELVAGELSTIETRSVRVDLNCSPWEWNCLGSRKVALYKKNEPYPFAVGVSDVPIVFTGEDVWVGIAGSRDIRYKVPKNRQTTVLKTGLVEIIPRASHRSGQLTDLMRVEASGSHSAGHTLDLSLTSPTTMPLVVGNYFVSSYLSATHADGARTRSRSLVAVRSKTPVTKTINVYLSERALKRMEKDNERKQVRSSLPQRIRLSRNYAHARPLKFR